MSRTLRSIPAIGIAIAVIFAFSAPTIGAQTTSTPASSEDQTPSRAFEFYPASTGFGSYFDIEIEAGSSSDLVVFIGNTGDVEQEIATFSLNAFTSAGGGFAADATGGAPNEVTRWLSASNETLTIGPGTGVEKTFTVSVPEGTPPGEYLTALAAEHADARDISGSDLLQQKLRYVVPVLITVPGDTTAGFEVGGIQLAEDSGSLLLRVELRNTGDVRVRPLGSVELFDQDGKLVASIPVEMQSVYARDSTSLTLLVPGALSEGTFRARVDLTDPETGAVASFEKSDLSVRSSGTPVAAVSVQFLNASITSAPSPDSVQYVAVEAVVLNSGNPIANGQLSLLVMNDGEQVERFPISQSLSLPQGETEVSTRYIPAEGFTTGTWTFELLIETVDASGAAVVQASQPIEGSVVIP